LLKAVDPRDIFEGIKKDYSKFLESIQTTLNKEVMKVKENDVCVLFISLNHQRFS